MRCKIQSTVFRKISFLSQQKPSKPSLTPTKNHLKRQCNWPMDCYLTSFMESTSGIRWETEGGVPLSVRARMQSCIQYINYSVKNLLVLSEWFEALDMGRGSHQMRRSCRRRGSHGSPRLDPARRSRRCRRWVPDRFHKPWCRVTTMHRWEGQVSKRRKWDAYCFASQ